MSSAESAQRVEKVKDVETFNMNLRHLRANSADGKLFSYFFLKIGFDILSKLSSKETICIKSKAYYLMKKKSKGGLLIFYPAF